MENFFKVLLVFFIIFSNGIFVQWRRALPLLSSQQSPLLIGAGEIGVAVPIEDAIWFYLNPAQLGYSSKENYLSFLFLLFYCGS